MVYWVSYCAGGLDSFGTIGKQHQSMNAMNATNVPMRRMKSSMVCGGGGKHALVLPGAQNTVVSKYSHLMYS